MDHPEDAMKYLTCAMIIDFNVVCFVRTRFGSASLFDFDLLLLVADFLFVD